MRAHRSTTARVLALVAAVGLVPFGLAVVSSLPAADAPTTVQPAALSTPAYVPNWVAIETGATSQVTLNGPDGRIGNAQSLAPGANCGVNLGTPQLLTLAGSTGGNVQAGLASYAAGSIGVKEKKSGTSCYQVNAVTTESLRIGLGSGVTAAIPGAVASSAYLDVELKGGVRIVATARMGLTTVGTFELRSGSLVGAPPVTEGVTPFECTTAADSGADSNVSDNCRWPISVPSWTAGGDDGIFFDSLTLDALAGSFSLEGGADGAVLPAAPNGTPNASILELVTDTLGCNASTPIEPGVGDEPSVSVYRLGNADGSTCGLIPYALANGSGFAQFLKPLDSQTSAQFIWEVTGPLAPTAGTTALKDITIDYETNPSANPELDRVRLDWCPDATYANGRFAGYTDAQMDAFEAAGLDQDEYPGMQYACVISRSASSVDGSPDVLQVNDLAYVYGDATMRR
ncbi:MAG TPA: hypothetical protein VFI44_01190 [Ornithinibacter sp.]|nr:hypothetical protein [Ornithinibacter sp.]